MQPTQSPLAQGDPGKNEVHFYKNGQSTVYERMVNAANSFCKSISRSKMIGKFHQSGEYPFDGGSVTIKISLDILKDTCRFIYDEATCMKYLSVPTDSCDCGGINGKHGGTGTNNCYEWKIDPEFEL